MTREEAIKWLKTFQGRYGLPELEQAVDLAIKTLEQEPKTGRWIENDKGAIICSYCNTWFHKERKEFMLNCPYCKAKMEE